MTKLNIAFKVSVGRDTDSLQWAFDAMNAHLQAAGFSIMYKQVRLTESGSMRVCGVIKGNVVTYYTRKPRGFSRMKTNTVVLTRSSVTARYAVFGGESV